jgi:hypothetical protein
MRNVVLVRGRGEVGDELGSNVQRPYSPNNVDGGWRRDKMREQV